MSVPNNYYQRNKKFIVELGLVKRTVVIEIGR
jgi:hypothetical protein